MRERVLILGFDGLDPNVCRRFMEEGELPAFTRLAAKGAFLPLGTTHPPISAASWRTVATGVNPGAHGVYEFTKRRADAYFPESSSWQPERAPFAGGGGWRAAAALATGGLGAGALYGLSRMASSQTMSRRAFLSLAAGGALAAGVWGGSRGAYPREIVRPRQTAGGTPFWETLGRAGAKTTVLWMPVTYPTAPTPGLTMLSGLGTPDIYGGESTYTLFATNMEKDEHEEGRVVPLRFDGDVAHSEIPGPLLADGRRADGIPVVIHRKAGGVTVTTMGQSLALRPGAWSDWLALPFAESWWRERRASGRFCLVAMEPEVRLYLSPLGYDVLAIPEETPIEQPPGLARGLALRHGTFKTLGWPTDTAILDYEVGGADMYLADWRDTMREQQAIAWDRLEADDWDCCYLVFTPTDQMQHMFRPGTPDGDAPVREAYRAADAFLARTLDAYDRPGTTLLAMSDHGFGPWDRAAHVNAWLAHNGYLRLNDGYETGKGPEGEEVFPGVDWSRTYAYALGINGLFLNLEGREPEGIVRPGGMAEAVLEKMTEGLADWRDPKTGGKVVKTLRRGGALYRGSRAHEAMDILIGYERGYRTSWETAMGGIPADDLTDNTDAWHNEHCGAPPEDMAGILFANRAVKTAPTRAPATRPAGGGAFPSVMDMAPTILSVLGVAPPDAYEGESFLG